VGEIFGGFWSREEGRIHLAMLMEDRCGGVHESLVNLAIKMISQEAVSSNIRAK
jgi:hypothetical protein